MDNQIVDKITKLLAKANGNITQAEAQLYMEKAQEIALRNEIDISSLKNLNMNESEIIRESLTFGKRLPTVNTYVVIILENFFNVRIVTSGRRETNRSVHLIGKTADIETSKYVYAWLSETMIRCWKNYYDSTPGAQLAQKQSYLAGFHTGLNAKLDKNKQDIISSQIQEVQTNYALAVVNTETRMENAMGKFFPKLKKAISKTVNVDAISYYKGIIDGNECNISKGGIGGKVVPQLGY